MTRTINAIYYDGQTSQPRDVSLNLLDEGIEICGSGEEQIIDTFWYMSKIKNVDFSSSDTLHLNYGAFPYQSIVIEDKGDIEMVKLHFGDYKFSNIHQKILKWNPFKVFLGSIVSLVAVIGLYMVYIAPFIAEKAVNLVPMKSEILLGKRLSEPILSVMDMDAEKSENLQEFYNSLGYESEYPIQLFVEKSNTVNAFAIPGGTIVVHEGLLNKMNNWEELAGLLAHELSHVEHQHSLKTMSRSLSTYLVISIITSDVSGLFSVFVDNAMQIQNLSNSRSFEREADEEGLKMMLHNNIDPKGILQLFEILQQESLSFSTVIDSSNIQKIAEVMEVMSSHPLTEKRIEYISNLIDVQGLNSFPKNLVAASIFQELQTTDGEMEDE